MDQSSQGFLKFNEAVRLWREIADNVSQSNGNYPIISDGIKYQPFGHSFFPTLDILSEELRNNRQMSAEEFLVFAARKFYQRMSLDLGNPHSRNLAVKFFAAAVVVQEYLEDLPEKEQASALRALPSPSEMIGRIAASSLDPNCI